MPKQKSVPNECYCSTMDHVGRTRVLQKPKYNTKAVFLNDKQWATGSTIRIAFVEGTKEQRVHVRTVAETWLKYANLKFEWDVPAEQSDVRVAFASGKGSWSYVGRDATSISYSKPTMNFGWLSEKPKSSERGTILHEFGHMLGLTHEHQNPKGGLTWKRDVVIQSLSGPPNNWTVNTIEANVLSKYDANNPNLTITEFDSDSVMMYFFPASWNEEGIESKSNDSLSTLDKAIMRKMYPTLDDDGNVVIDTEDSDDDDEDQKGCFTFFKRLLTCCKKQ